MLEIEVTLSEDYDESTEEFVVAKSFNLQLEHSLVSLAKWESVYEKPFISNDDKTGPELLAYVRMMILTPDVPEIIINLLLNKHIDEINSYINAKMTATWFREQRNPGSREVITAEIVYYWMVSLNIDFQCQYWHLNRLITLVRVCNEKNKPASKNKRGGRNAAAERAALNRQRQASLGTSG